jgi:uncharacterized protein involved in exopolysaccharide biosynthesis
MSGKTAQSELQLSFRDVVYHIFRFRRPALLAMLVAIALGVGFTLSTKPRYLAKAKLLLDLNSKDLSLLREENPAVRLNLEEMLFTEVEAIKSWHKVGPVLDSLRARGVAVPADFQQEPMEMLALPIRKSSFIDVSIRGIDPDFTAAYLNESLRQYAAGRNTFRQGNEELAHYQGILQEYERKIHESEVELAAFKEQHEIVLIDAQVRSRLGTLEQEKEDRLRLDREVRQQRSDLSTLRILKKNFRPELLTRDIQDRFPQLRWVVEEHQRASKELSDLLHIYREDNPDVIRLREELREKGRSMELVLDNQVEYASQELHLREEDMREVQTSIHGHEDRLSELSSVERDFEQMVQALSELHELRTTVVRKLEEMKLQSLQNGSYKLELVGEAVPIRRPVEPNILFNLLLTLFSAIGLGFLIPLYKWKTDDTIVTEADAERVTGLSTLGGIREQR